MAVNIRFDYFNLKIDKSRLRRKENAQFFFGEIPASKFCQDLESYFKKNKLNSIDNGRLIKEYNSGKKWIKWVSIDKYQDSYKLLFTFNDLEVDPRILESMSNDVLTQKIPDKHGLRTLLHIVITTKPVAKNEANICIQSVQGMSFKFLPALFAELLYIIYDDIFWTANDSMSQEEIKCKPHVEISSVTTGSIIQAVNQGLLQSIVLVEETKVTKAFDQNSVMKNKTKNLSIEIEDSSSFLRKVSPNGFMKWISTTKANFKDEFDADPRVFLMLKNQHNKSETKFEYVDDVMMGLTKRAYLNWGDRDINTINSLVSETPKSISQCFTIMIANF